MVEEVTIGGKNVRLTYEDVPIEMLHLDEDNPRIRYRARLEQGGKTREEVLMAMSEVKALRKDIEKNGGLRERVILQKNGKGYKVVEGNCRTVCLQSLHHKEPNNPTWQTVPARILPDSVDPKQVAILLSDFHVAGKITWNAHEKGGQVYYMVNELGMKQDDIAVYLRTSKSTVNRLLQAYELMVDRFLKIDNETYAKDGERKWSYFEEFFKQKVLREELKKNPEFGDDFCRWVGEGRLPKGENVRDLPAILENPEVRKKFEKGMPFDDVIKIVEAAHPEINSDFFKLLERVRESCTNTGQIKEILRIRGDQVARDRLIETYDALVDFMKLADVDPDAVPAKKTKKTA
jgi:hypothetical protein